jgi:hypothetical protein
MNLNNSCSRENNLNMLQNRSDQLDISVVMESIVKWSGTGRVIMRGGTIRHSSSCWILEDCFPTLVSVVTRKIDGSLMVRYLLVRPGIFQNA